MKKRILMVCVEDFSNAGVQNVIMSIVRNLKEDFTFDVLLFCNKKGYFDDEFLSYGGKILRLPHLNTKSDFLKRAERYYCWILNFSKVVRLLTENGPYYGIHCHNDYESGYILKAAKKCGIPIRISHVHRIVEKSKKGYVRVFQKTWNSLAIKYSTKLLACSSEAGKSFYGKEYFEIVENLYDENKYRNNNNCNDGLNILQVGSYSDNKNQLFSIDVFSYLVKTFPDAKLKFVGFENQHNYLLQLKNKIDAKGLRDNVLFYPSDYDKQALLEKSAYFLFPSKLEGFGLVLVEAQAAGVRCYASNTVPQITNCGGCAYLPLSLGAERWAEIIIEDYKKTGGAHGNFDCSRFESKTVAKKISGFYEGIE